MLSFNQAIDRRLNPLAELHERIRDVRKSLKPKTSQSVFAEMLGTSRDTIANYEGGRVVPTDTFIQLLCTKFNVSNEWLRTGEGNMYVDSETSLVDSLTKQMNMSAEQRKLMEIFLTMSDEKRDSVSKAFFDFLDAARQLDAAESAALPSNPAANQQHTMTHDELEAEVESYRAALIAEQKGQSASDSGSSAAKMA
nr:MAG TPA: helix-turn-helix domain protein [Caudoviricetes sp.]